MAILLVCILSTLLYENFLWTTQTEQGEKVKSFNLKNLHPIMNTRWNIYCMSQMLKCKRNTEKNS